MSGISTPINSERDAQLLSIGQQCSAELCHLVDFLPFKCQHCGHAFCGEHFRPQAHKCEKYDESKHNRVAPPCPLCNTPVAIPPGVDPNIRMERHFNNECSVMTGKSGKSSSTPHCARPKCGKVLWAPIKCDKCNQQFCPAHRFPNTHTCVSTPSKSNTPASSSSSNLLGNTRPNPTSAASAAAMAAIKRAMNNTSSASTHKPTATTATTQNKPPAPSKPVAISSATTSSSQPSSSAKPASSRTNPFSATDRSPATPPLTDNNPDDTATPNNDPPERCAPKSTYTNPMAYIPRPLFTTA
ncbi:unnamed protein product [Somion occarium]|uniref:AN1-type domain-containing protein n=1 Tax=Somion occarium TaxID=3059160 RepID=A0ABP1E0J4_9APHY